ncbi:zinc finger protein 354A-like [Corythoichthys intestinalis]|uniref:zinc finger protein 354A-like n=1 Tax=Corythoichthys intestinalis TaxID=161448 RepID=UPI0025A616CC|nr:zinc finger protein 354A-like [Corythoichthys intestinalis]
MLKDMVKELLTAAADEIFDLFEQTIAFYAEKLCQAREESERHRRQLEAVCKTQVSVRLEDVQLLLSSQEALRSELPSRRCTLKQEHSPAGDVKVKVEDSDLTHVKEEEVDVITLSPPGIPVVNEGHEEESADWQQSHHHSPKGDQQGEAPPDNLFASLSYSDVMEEPLEIHADYQGDDKQSNCSQKEMTLANEDITLNCQKTLSASHSSESVTNKSQLVTLKTFPPEQPLPKIVSTCTGEKCYCCSLCTQTFNKNQELIRHMKTHRGLEIFSCELCNRTFSCKGTMYKHMRTHPEKQVKSCLKIPSMSNKRSLKRPCCVPVCSVLSRYSEDMSFHAFPDDPTILAEWKRNIAREDLNPTKRHRVCSQHFKKTDFYMAPDGQRKLKTGSVPVYFAWNQHKLEPEMENQTPIDHDYCVLKQE